MQLASCVVFLTAAGHCGGAELVLPSLSLERDRPVVAVFRTALQATGKGELDVEWTDVLGRVVERRTARASVARRRQSKGREGPSRGRRLGSFRG